MKRYLPFVIVAVVALATIGSGTMLLPGKATACFIHSRQDTLRKKRCGVAAHSCGNPDAPVTLEEYGDFQCPPCGMFSAFLGQLEKEYDSRLRVVFRNFPLNDARACPRSGAGCGSGRTAGPFLGDARRALSGTRLLEQGP